MVFQEPSTALNPVYTVGWQIAEGLRAHGEVHARRRPGPRRSRCSAGSASPTRSTRVDHYPHQFSGGQKQRIVIAMALALDPGVIVADEPTTALDVTVQAEILDLLRALPRRVRHRDRADHPQHGRRRRPRRPRRGHVPGRGRRGRPTSRRSSPSPQHDYTKQLLAAVPHLGTGTAQTRPRAAAPTAGPTRRPVVEATDLRDRVPGPAAAGRPSAPSTASSFAIRARRGARAGRRVRARARPRSAAPSPGLTQVTGGSLKVLGARDARRQGARLPARRAATSASSSRTRRRASTRCSRSPSASPSR